MNKFFIFLMLTSMMISAGKFAEANSQETYYIEIDGNDVLKERIFQKLSSKPCFTISDIDPSSSAKDCHAFMRATKDTKISGKNKYLFKVKIRDGGGPNSPRVISLQGFKNNGKKIYRYFNPGSFSIPSKNQIQNGKADYSEDKFIEESSSIIIELSFK